MFVDEQATKVRVREILAATARVRDLPSKGEIPVSIEDPATMRAHMEAQIDAQLDARTRLGTEQTWLALGLVEPGFDVATAYASVMEDAVGGYFDPEKGRLVLVRRDMGGASSGGFGRMLEDMVIAHELVHGLQDQHFDLWRITRREGENSDASSAVHALIEGDASYAMLYRLPMGIDPDMLDMDMLKGMMAGAGGPSANPGGALGAAPRIMREVLVFPYTEGLAFTQAIKKRGEGWEQVDAAYHGPPLSTEQILHPERYGPDGDWPTDLRASAERWLGGHEELQQDTMGELGVRIVLQEHVQTIDAAEVADGWDGDRLWTLYDGETPVIVWRTTWDTEEDATAFARAAGAMLMTLHPDAVPSTRRGDFMLVGSRQDRVRQRGADVAVVIAAPGRTGRLVRKALRVRGTELRSLDQVGPVEPRPDPNESD